MIGAIAGLAMLPLAQAVTILHGAIGVSNSSTAPMHIWADPATPGTVFDRWVGDTTSVADPYAWHTTINSADAYASITATYKPASIITPTSYVLNGLPDTDPNAVRMIYYFPQNIVGVIFLFHGSGGSASGWYNNNVENLAFCTDAVAAGYGVVALDSLNRVSRAWNPDITALNPDILNVQTGINYLVAMGLMTAQTPKFSAGMSDGGQFAPRAAYFLGFKGCAIWCAAGQPTSIFSDTTVPTIWNLAQVDDSVLHINFVKMSTKNLNTLASRGVDGEWRENPPSPVYPRRFMRIPGLTEADSQSIFDGLKANGYLNSDNYLTSDPDTNNWQSSLRTTYSTITTMSINDQLDCCYASHKFFSDYNNSVIRFFGSKRSARPGYGGISQVAPQRDGSISLTVAAEAGQNYQIEASTDLANWSPIGTNLYAPGTFNFPDVNAASFTSRFYRTSILPPGYAKDGSDVITLQRTRQPVKPAALLKLVR